MASLPKVPKIALGKQGLIVSKQGLGAMGMSQAYGPGKPEADMIELIHYAVESGITFIDTADVYGPHVNEILVGKAIKGIREKVQIATKFSLDRSTGLVRGDPEYVRSCVDASLKRLDVEYIDLYYQHRVDPTTPIEVTVGAMKEAVEAGKVKYIGLSEASASEIRRAHAVHPITALQLEYSIWCRECEEDILPTCRELGIGIVPYSPLGRGFFSGITADQFTDNDFRKGLPRFQVENMEKNRAFYDRLVAIAAKRNATPGQLALAWVQHQGDDVAPIPGTTKKKNLEENIGSLAVHLSKEEVKEIEEAVPHEEIAGERYGDSMMAITGPKTSTPPLSDWDYATNSLYATSEWKQKSNSLSQFWNSMNKK